MSLDEQKSAARALQTILPYRDFVKTLGLRSKFAHAVRHFLIDLSNGSNDVSTAWLTIKNGPVLFYYYENN